MKAHGRYGGKHVENCIYHGKQICSYDLKDEWGIYHQEDVIRLKRAAAQGELYCTDCKERVYLAAGLIREPYFAHYDAKECSYGNSGESEELRLGKRLLYQLLLRSFPKEAVRVRHRLKDGSYTSFYVETEQGGRIAIDYRLTQMSIKQLDIRKNYFLQNQIKPIFILSTRQDKNCEQINWYQSYIQELLGYCIFFDAFSGELELKRGFQAQFHQFRANRMFQEKLLVNETTIREDGTLSSDFLESCRKKEKEMIEHLKQQYQSYEREQERRYNYYQQQLDKDASYEREQLINRLLRIVERIDFTKTELSNGIRRDILLNCIEMIHQGEVELVSTKYLNYILECETL